MEISNILSEETIAYIEGAYSGSQVWSDGPLSGNQQNKKFKSNSEYIGPCYEDIRNKLHTDLNNNLQWRTYIVAPKSSSPPFLLRYKKGDLYKAHCDASRGLNGTTSHFTTIISLSDPKDYSGGEFELEIFGSMKKFKLPKNTALVYPTGAKHAVRKVTRGVRLSILLWTESFITDEEDRQTLRQLQEMANNLSEFLMGDLGIPGSDLPNHPLGPTLLNISRLSESIHLKYPRPRDSRCYLMTE